MSTGMSLGTATFKVQGDGFDDMRLRFAKMREDLVEIASAQTKVEKAGDAMGRGVQRGAKQSAWALMELSRGLEDMQYGFNAVVNNIPGFVMAIGGSAGIAGAVSIAAVGINQLVQHWDDLKDRFQAAWSGSTVEQLKKIREEAEAAAEAFDKLAKTPTEAAAKGGKQLEKAMVEGDLGKWLEAVTVEVGKTPGLAATEQEAFARDPKRAFAARPGKAAEVLDQLMFEENRERASRLLGQAREPGAKGDAARKILRGMNLPPEMMGAVAAADPAAQKRQADFEKNLDVQRQVQRRIREQEQAGQRKIEERIAGEHRIVQGRKEVEADRGRRERERDQKERQFEANFKHRRHVLQGAQDIGEDMREFRRRNMRAEFTDFAGFWNSTQQNILNNPADIQKQQLEALKRIERLIEDNPQMRGQIMQAVAGNPP